MGLVLFGSDTNYLLFLCILPHFRFFGNLDIGISPLKCYNVCLVVFAYCPTAWYMLLKFCPCVMVVWLVSFLLGGSVLWFFSSLLALILFLRSLFLFFYVIILFRFLLLLRWCFVRGLYCFWYRLCFPSLFVCILVFIVGLFFYLYIFYLLCAFIWFFLRVWSCISRDILAPLLHLRSSDSMFFQFSQQLPY